MRPFLSPTALLLTLLAAQGAQSILPEALPVKRYEHMLEKSPFALATLAAPVQEKAPPVFANLVLTGVVPMRDERGAETYFVSIQSRDRQERFQLFGSEPNAEGISIASVDWAPQVGKTTVTLKKGSEFGKVEFDEMALQTPVAAAAAPRPGQVALPGAVPMPGGVNPAAGNRGGPMSGRISVPRPGNAGPQPTSGSLPRPASQPQQAPLPTQQMPPSFSPPQPGNAASPGNDNRRRIRVINSKP